MLQQIQERLKNCSHQKILKEKFVGEVVRMSG